MAGRYLLDTNIVIALFAQDANVLKELQASREVFIPSIVLGELYYGARKSGRVAANVLRVNELAAKSAVLSCDVETAHHYGIVKNALRAKGTPLPENDIWIGAIAAQHHLIVVTRDAHFDEIEDVKVAEW